MIKEFLKNVLTSGDPSSTKRLLTLIMALHFILTAFLISFFVFYLILYTPRGSVNKDLLDLLEKIIEHDIYVILVGIGAIAAENMGNIMLERAKAKMQIVAQQVVEDGGKPEDKNKPVNPPKKEEDILDNDV